MTRDLFDMMNEGRGPRHVDADDQVESVKLCDLEMVLHYDTGRAVLVSDTGEESRAVWLPKSQIEISPPPSRTVSAVKKDGQRVVLPVVTVTMPTWIAKDKGLV